MGCSIELWDPVFAALQIDFITQIKSVVWELVIP